MAASDTVGCRPRTTLAVPFPLPEPRFRQMGGYQAATERALPAVWELFGEHTQLRAVIDAVLEGRVGSVRTEPDPHPRAAALRVGCYHIFGGDAGTNAAKILVNEAPAPTELVYAGEPWRRRIAAVHETAASPDPMQGFDPSELDVALLSELAQGVPDGFEIRRMTRGDAQALGPELSPHGMQVYETADAFIDRGVGYIAAVDNQLACVASSYAASAERVEVAISTAEPWRGRRLATAVAANLLLHCLQRGITPDWNAANPVSQRLAERLGYRAAGTVTILRLAEMPGDA